MTEKPKSEKTKRVPMPGWYKKSLGVKFPSKNPILHATKDADLERLPTVLRPLFERIAAKGTEGVTLNVIAHGARGIRWNVRVLAKLGLVTMVAETKPKAK